MIIKTCLIYSIDEQNKENNMDISSNSNFYDDIPIKSGPKFKINEYSEGDFRRFSMFFNEL